MGARDVTVTNDTPNYFNKINKVNIKLKLSSIKFIINQWTLYIHLINNIKLYLFQL